MALIGIKKLGIEQVRERIENEAPWNIVCFYYTSPRYTRSPTGEVVQIADKITREYILFTKKGRFHITRKAAKTFKRDMSEVPY